MACLKMNDLLRRENDGNDNKLFKIAKKYKESIFVIHSNFFNNTENAFFNIENTISPNLLNII